MKRLKRLYQIPRKGLSFAFDSCPTDWLSDKQYLKIKYRLRMGKRLDLQHPKTLNEKLQWLKLHNRRPEYTMMVDKYAVRSYIAEQLGEEYLIPLLGVWDHPEDICFDELPNRFVLKCNHNSGLGMCICRDKSRLNIPQVRRGLEQGLKQDYYLTGREWPYKNVPRKILAEQYMTDETDDELKDYKFFCFNGIPKVILVCSDRFSQTGLKEDFFDVDWHHLPVKRPQHPNSSKAIDRPSLLDKMLQFAQILAKDIPFVRIDFYCIKKKVYFGEITFYPASGFERFEPDEWDYNFGYWIQYGSKG